MLQPFLRRTALSAVALCLLIDVRTWAASVPGPNTANDRLAALERTSGGRLGVATLSADNSVPIRYRADERFPFCSTFKVMLAGAILQRSATETDLLDRHIPYSKDELVTYSPITEIQTGRGMTVSHLCAAALQYSDNTAANLLIKLLGGPDAVTTYARSLGDTQFRLDRWETDLNEALPGDPRDTTTPAAMAQSLHRLALGDGLHPPGRHQLTDWMLGNTTGAARIQAGVPKGWQVADKTGTGAYGTTNDIAVIWPPNKPPIALAIYFTQGTPDAAARNDVIADAARIVADALAETPSATK